MLNNTENIEARLCAFVEGDLDEQARAEIEKHLETHPAHRALLDELKRTKAMMMALPREQAPVDMAETLQGHLERSVLLDGVGTSELESTLKINRWPQLMAVAAVVLLAVGLGALVYVVLPAHSSSQQAYVMKDKDKLASSSETTKALEADEKAKVEALREEKELGKVGSKPGDTIAMTPTAAPVVGGAPDTMARGVITAAGAGEPIAAKPAADLSLKDGAPPTIAMAGNDRSFSKSDAATNGGGGGAIVAKPEASPAKAMDRYLCVVVSTDNLETTNAQLASYLASKNIAWQPASNDGVLTQSANDVAMASRMNLQHFQLKSPPTNGDSANGATLANGTLNDQKKQQSMSKKGGEGYNQYNSIANNGYNSKTGQQEQSQQSAVSQNQFTQAAQGQNADTQAKPVAIGEPTTQPTYDLAASKTENVIIARGLTRQQTAELSDALAKQYAGQTAVMIDRDGDVAAPEAIKAKLNKAASEGGTNLFGSTGATTQPTTQPAADAISLDKSLPTAEPNAAPAGGIIAAATPVTEPTTQPMAQQAPVPSADLNLNPKPTTDEPMDVMIVVQTSTPPTANAEPNAAIPATTQPATPDMAAPAAPNATGPTTSAAPVLPAEVAPSAPATPTTEPAQDNPMAK